DGVAVEDVAVGVGGGSVHGLRGWSGSGKSTVLRLILGLLMPESGNVLVDGTRVTEATRTALVRRMGYVVQDGGLYPHLTAYDNVALPARAQAWPGSRIRERIATLGTMVGLDAAM